MAIKSAKYDIKTDTGYDTIHFQTDTKMVKVLDDKKNELGNLNELGFIGKKVTTGSIKDIKTSGIYRARGLRGMPSSVRSNEEVVLSVIATKDDNGNTSFVNYKVITRDGSIINKTIVGRVESDWSSGGTALQETVDDIRKELGNNTNLTTSSKRVVDAINELHSLIKGSNTNLTTQITDVKNRNYDSRYIKTYGQSDMQGDIKLHRTAGLQLKNEPKQGVNNVLSVDTENNIRVGNTYTDLNIYSKGDIKYNTTHKVWTSANDGKGSGLDADKVQGRTDIPFSGTPNTYTATQEFKSFIKVGDNLGDVRIHGSKEQLDVMGGISATKNINTVTGNISGATMTVGTGNRIHCDGQRISVGGTVNMELTKGWTDVYNPHLLGKVVIQGKYIFIQQNQPSGTNHPHGSIWIS